MEVLPNPRSPAISQVDTFKVPKVGIAAGCRISEGEMSRDDNIRLIRDGFVVYDGKIASLRRLQFFLAAAQHQFQARLLQCFLTKVC